MTTKAYMNTNSTEALTQKPLTSLDILDKIDLIVSSLSTTQIDSERFLRGKSANGRSGSNVNADPEGLLNTQDQQPVGVADFCGVQAQGAPRYDEGNGFTSSGDRSTNNINTGPGELENYDHPVQDLLHKDITVSNDMAAGSLRPHGSGSASGCNSGTDPPARSATGGTDTAPRIQPVVNSTVITRHDINNTQNVGGVGLSHVSPSDDADSRVHGDRPALHLAPPTCGEIRTSRMRLFTPSTSRIPRCCQLLHIPFVRTSGRRLSHSSLAAAHLQDLTANASILYRVFRWKVRTVTAPSIE
ncbi:hypothetical protein PQX77_008930 [Marasmius sp. AFHP31]|nr:hypothetical protein PQX77_008930 [Marasmius sp. AFHP31]